MKGRILILVILMSFSLVAVLAVQYYWLKAAIKLRSDEFDQSVHTVLESVNDKLVLSSSIKLMSSKFKNEQVLDKKNSKNALLQYIVHLDSNINGGSKKHLNNIRVSMVDIVKDSTHKIISTTLPDIKGDTHVLNKKSIVIKRIKDTTLIYNRTTNLDKALSKIMYGYLATQKSPIESINKTEVDTLLRNALKQYNIDLPYVWYIKNNRDSLVLAKYPKQSVSSTSFNITLFSPELITTPYTLALNFTGKTLFILKHISWLLMLAVIFTLAVIGSFGYALHLIYSQKRLSQMKNDFINNMTHEFKTPLATISLTAQSLYNSDVQNNAPLTDAYLGLIQEETRRLNGHIEKILEAARFRSNDIKLKKEPVDINELVTEACNKIKKTMVESGGDVQLHLDAINYIVDGDKIHLFNILYNLLDNAIKYSPNKPDVNVRAFNTKGKLHIVVADKGMGISRADTKKIFEPFYRVSSGNIHEVKGFGLGLNYVMNIIKAHKGSINVNSELGKGSTFEIILPII